MTTPLPPNANLQFYKKQAKKRLNTGEVDALHQAQLAIAEEHGFNTWTNFKRAIEAQQDSIKAFVLAVRSNNPQAVKDTVHEYPELTEHIDGPWFDFDTPAVVFARKNLAMVDTLLSLGADINKKSEFWAGGFGVLDYDITDDNGMALAHELIKRGANVDVHAAAIMGDLATLKRRIETNPALVHDKGGDGKTPLHWAKTVEIAAYLLAHDADINAKCIDHHSTPAQYLVAAHPEVTRYLMAQGCEQDILMAVAVGDLDQVKAYVNDDPDAIYWAVSREYLELITPEFGGSIYGWTLGFDLTLLQLAKKFGHDHVYTWLMDNSPMNVTFATHCMNADTHHADDMLKANPDIINTLRKQDQMQLANAAKHNNLPAVKYMLQVGFPVNARGQHGATALHWAAFHGNADMTQHILTYSPDITITDQDYNGLASGWAIQGSVAGWHKDTGDFATTLEILLNAGLDYQSWMYDAGSNAIKDKLTALHLAPNDS